MAFRQETADGTPRRIVNWHKNRQTLSIANDSGVKCYIYDGALNITTKGWPLSVGQSVIFIQRDGDDPRNEIWAQTGGANTDLRINEGVGLEGT